MATLLLVASAVVLEAFNGIMRNAEQSKAHSFVIRDFLIANDSSITEYSMEAEVRAKTHVMKFIRSNVAVSLSTTGNAFLPKTFPKHLMGKFSDSVIMEEFAGKEAAVLLAMRVLLYGQNFTEDDASALIKYRGILSRRVLSVRKLYLLVSCFQTSIYECDLLLTILL